MGNEKLREAFEAFEAWWVGGEYAKRPYDLFESNGDEAFEIWQAATAATQRDAMAVAEAVAQHVCRVGTTWTHDDLAAIVEAVQPGCTKQEPANRHAALPWSYRRYGSEPDKGYTIIAKEHGATHGTPIAYLADGEVAGQAAQDICNAHNAAITAEAAQPASAQQQGEPVAAVAWPDGFIEVRAQGDGLFEPQDAAEKSTPPVVTAEQFCDLADTACAALQTDDKTTDYWHGVGAALEAVLGVVGMSTIQLRQPPSRGVPDGYALVPMPDVQRL